MLKLLKIICRILTLLSTCVCDMHWSPTKMRCFIFGSSSGIIDSHSFTWLASSITTISNDFMSNEWNSNELETVQKINFDARKQTSLIDSFISIISPNSEISSDAAVTKLSTCDTISLTATSLEAQTRVLWFFSNNKEKRIAPNVFVFPVPAGPSMRFTVGLILQMEERMAKVAFCWKSSNWPKANWPYGSKILKSKLSLTSSLACVQKMKQQ